jgi:predicted CopG family antitoxin
MQTNTDDKRKTVSIGEDAHNQAKLKATKEKKSLKEYLEELIKKDTKQS